MFYFGCFFHHFQKLVFFLWCFLGVFFNWCFFIFSRCFFWVFFLGVFWVFFLKNKKNTFLTTIVPTCRHADNDTIVHLIFSRKQSGLVVKTCRHANVISMLCAFVGDTGVCQNMPICQQYPMIHMGSREYIWGGIQKYRQAEMLTLI